MDDTVAKGQKFDKGKTEWYRMPLSVLRPLADVYNNPVVSAKYEAFNCLKPFDNADKRFWDATMRHLEASQLDPLAINEEDGGVFHLAQVAFNALHRLHDALQRQTVIPEVLSPIETLRKMKADAGISIGIKGAQNEEKS